MIWTFSTLTAPKALETMLTPIVPELIPTIRRLRRMTVRHTVSELAMVIPGVPATRMLAT